MNIQNIVALEHVAFDIQIGEDFYETQSIGLGSYFRDSIISDIESLWIYGGVHQKVYGLYRALSKRFPYAIYYHVNETTLTVFAVLDLRQNPKSIYKFIFDRSTLT